MKNFSRSGGMALAFATLVSFTSAKADDRAEMPGPIDSLSDLQDAGKILFKLADENNDGQISQKEAIDAGNLFVGGFFFRADANGDGVLSQEEAKQARDAFLNQHPILRALARQIKPAPAATNAQPGTAVAANPLQALGALVDTNNDKQMQATELRTAVQTTVQGLYASADTNRDGQLSPSEVNAGLVGIANAAAQTAFDMADTDHNGQLSIEEFDKAIVEPAHTVFRSMDLNGDGQLSAQESQAARNLVMSQLKRLRVPEPANSARNLIRSGASPEQVAPVPTFRPGATQPAPSPSAPTPAPAPATPAAPAPTTPPNTPQQ